MNSNNVALDLFYKVRSRFTGLKLGNSSGEIVIVPEDARFFDFNYVSEDKPVGHVTISIAEPNSMKVYFSNEITESMQSEEKKKWFGFLKELRQFAKRRLMSFDTRDIAKDNLDKRDYEFLAKKETNEIGESMMNEGTMYGTRKTSYQALQDTKLIIKHSKPLMDEQAPGARARNISALFIENSAGERFKYPFIHLAGARAMQRHIANGGLPYDEIGGSIVKMSEQIAQLKSFSNYVVRNDLMNSDNNSLIERGQQELFNIKDTINKIAKQSHYENYVSNFQAPVDEELPEDIQTDLTNRFTVKSFNEEISAVFPMLYKFMKENEVGYDDIVSMTQTKGNESKPTKTNDLNKGFEKLESWITELGEESAISSQDTGTQEGAIEQLNKLTGEHFPAGNDGMNAIESLKGIIEDPKLDAEIKKAAEEDPDQCVRPLIKKWLESNAPEVVDRIDFGDMVEEEKDDDEDEPPFDADENPTDKDEFGNTIKTKNRAKHLAKKGMRQAMDVKEVAEFIKSFYDQKSGTFPKGPEGVATMVGKKFGEQAEHVARKFVERMAPQQTVDEGDIDINQHPQTKDYGPGSNPELEDKVVALLKRFEENAMEMGAYGKVDLKSVVAMIAQGDPGAAADEVYGSYTDKDGGEAHNIDSMVDDLQAEFEELANMFGESVGPEEIDRLKRLSGL